MGVKAEFLLQVVPSPSLIMWLRRGKRYSGLDTETQNSREIKIKTEVENSNICISVSISRMQYLSDEIPSR
jgi:hypothetical protein